MPDIPGSKICSKCGQAKPIEQFGNRKASKDGKQFQCNECKSTYNKGYLSTHKEERKQYWEQYKGTHRDKIAARMVKYDAGRKEKGLRHYQLNPAQNRAQAKAWYHEHKDEMHAYREAHREKRRQQARQWYATHQDEIMVYRATHRTETAARGAAWRKAHPERVAAKEKRRRAQKYNAPVNDLTHEQWVEIQERQDHRCYYCGKRRKGKLTHDHITALSNGGSHTLHNVIAACRSCNSTKGANDPSIPVQPFLLTEARPKPFKKKGA